MLKLKINLSYLIAGGNHKAGPDLMRNKILNLENFENLSEI